MDHLARFRELRERPIVVIDTETTGLPWHSWANVVELAAVVLAPDGSEASFFSSLARPPTIPPRADVALKINGLTRAQIFNARPVADVAADYAAWLRGAVDPDALLTSYNVDFDRDMVGRMSPGLDLGEWGPCIMVASMGIMGPAGKLLPADPTHPRYRLELPWLFPKLVDVASYFDIATAEPAHRALSDARTAAGVLHRIRSTTS
jgi:DNA polymerase III epsilon subunit-like protein